VKRIGSGHARAVHCREAALAVGVRQSERTSSPDVESQSRFAALDAEKVR
jgi:hypothetical protein